MTACPTMLLRLCQREGASTLMIDCIKRVSRTLETRISQRLLHLARAHRDSQKIIVVRTQKKPFTSSIRIFKRENRSESTRKIWKFNIKAIRSSLLIIVKSSSLKTSRKSSDIRLPSTSTRNRCKITKIQFMKSTPLITPWTSKKQPN